MQDQREWSIRHTESIRCAGSNDLVISNLDGLFSVWFSSPVFSSRHDSHLVVDLCLACPLGLASLQVLVEQRMRVTRKGAWFVHVIPLFCAGNRVSCCIGHKAGKMFEKSLNDLIRGIRAHKSNEVNCSNYHPSHYIPLSVVFLCVCVTGCVYRAMYGRDKERTKTREHGC